MMQSIKILFLIILFSSKASAIRYNEYMMLHQANKCSNYFAYFEEKNRIPKHLLRSISTIESGRWSNETGLYLPWPWAVNQGGKAYYFATKEEAIENVKKMLRNGITNIDIGCMQINLHHHPQAFNNLNQAFEPKDNIEYASNYLKQHYNKFGSWKKAVAAYHSLNEFGNLYAAKVYKIYLKYKNASLAINPCTSVHGNLVSCKSKLTSSNIDLRIDKRTNEEVVKTVSSNKTYKDPKRLKSAMILYSVNLKETNE